MISRVLFLVAVALAAAACGAAKRHAAPQANTTTPSVRACKLTTAQRHAVALALADIRRLREIQAPLHTFSERGTPAQERVTGKFLTDMGGGKLPINERLRLIRLAKAAVGLCGLCFQGLEAEEPVLAGKSGQSPCGG